jgi:hypothetical protein
VTFYPLPYGAGDNGARVSRHFLKGVYREH